MSLRPGEISPVPEIHFVPGTIRRVERDKRAQDFGQKNPQEREGKKKEEAEEESPHDVVELSAASHPAVPTLADVIARPAAPSPQAQERAPATSAPVERHLDIEV